MREVHFHYGKEKISHKFEESELLAVLTSSIEEYVPEMDEIALVEEALKNPVDSPSLSELAKGKQNIVIIASDHTRPVPSKVIMPAMLREIRKGSPDADITILIATGCHRGTTRDELVSKFGEEIVNNENIYIHDCDEREKLVNIGTLPSGGECEINSIAYNADLLVAEGFIEPHFFAGFSGGRKSVLPGIAGRTTVLANHCSEFINDKNSRTGILENNRIHEDMLWAAKTAKLKFIVNVVLNADKKVIYAVAGEAESSYAVSFITSAEKENVTELNHSKFPSYYVTESSSSTWQSGTALIRNGAAIYTIPLPEKTESKPVLPGNAPVFGRYNNSGSANCRPLWVQRKGSLL